MNGVFRERESVETNLTNNFCVYRTFIISQRFILNFIEHIYHM